MQPNGYPRANLPGAHSSDWEFGRKSLRLHRWGVFVAPDPDIR
jgi:hypothetical protein